MITPASLVAPLLLGSVALLAGAAPGTAAPPGPTDPAVFGEEFGSLTPHETPFDGALAERVAGLTGVPESQLVAVELLGGTASHKNEDGEEEEVGVTALVVPMGDSPETGSVGVAIDAEGRVIAVALFGTPEFDEDRNGYWESFRWQFKAPGGMSRTQPLEGALTPEEIDAHADAVFDEGLTSGTVADAMLYRHRYIMRENSARFTTLDKMRGRGEAPTGDWLRDWAGSLGWVGTIAEEMEPLIGPAAAGVYEESARRGHEQLIGAAEVADGGSPPQAVNGALRGLYRNSCMACHDTEDHPLGDRTLYFDLRDRIIADIRTDLGDVGMDVWGPRDGVRRIAKDAAVRVRAALLLLGTLEE